MPLRKPILRSCCCWRSLRTGCYVSGAYSMAYFLMTILMMTHCLYDERKYLMGNQTKPESDSFIDPKKITGTTVMLNLVLLICASVGVPATILLFVGVCMFYAILCVISQYQEYMLGRGTAADDDSRQGFQMQSTNEGTSKVHNTTTDLVNQSSKSFEVTTRIRHPVLNPGTGKSHSTIQKKVKFPDETLFEESLVQ